MIETLTKTLNLLSTSFEQTAIFEGTSDIIVTRWKNNEYHSSPFLVCFGQGISHLRGQKIQTIVNNILIEDAGFTLGRHGYLNPMYPDQQTFSKLFLSYGKNKIKFILNDKSHPKTIETEIHLLDECDKILISDVDGTMTKKDIPGLFNNCIGNSYLHEGYSELIKTMHLRGVKIVWLTMRSMALYSFSKKYIEKETNVPGILLTEPEEMLPALKKELMKKTGNIKLNMIKQIRAIFPENSTPFIGGLGNRENDAIAYKAASVSPLNIYLVESTSILRCPFTNQSYTFGELASDPEKYFSYKLNNEEQRNEQNEKILKNNSISTNTSVI